MNNSIVLDSEFSVSQDAAAYQFPTFPPIQAFILFIENFTSIGYLKARSNELM